VRAGTASGRFRASSDPDRIAVLAIALADGIGIPLALGDPQITAAGAAQDVLTVLARLLLP
jgi:BetI-type transcriptional repressor, C-terminal